MAKIIKYTQIEPIRPNILKAHELELILAANQYHATIKKKADDLLEDTQNQIEALKKQTYQEMVTKVNQENQELLVQTEQKIERMLQRLSEDLFALIYRILQKLGMDEIKPTMIRQLIKNEISELSEIKPVVISANSHTLTQLEQLFTEVPVKLVKNDMLLNDECICESELYIFRLNVAEAIEKIKNLLLK